MGWIEAVKRIATDPSVKVICPVCQKVYLKVRDIPNENNPSEVQRQMLCDKCGAFNALRLTKQPLDRDNQGSFYLFRC